MALICFGWLYILIAVLVRIKLGSPVIFKQERPGRDERIFTIYKFRTMADRRDENGGLLPDSERLTKFGRFLRSTSLDELPEAWNVLKGDMSVVGPRPLLAEYLPLYSEGQRRRHGVRPGVSGLSQISGRNSLNWEKKFEYDIQYIESIGFRTDLGIICMTVWKAFFKFDGINQKEKVTMDIFSGSYEVFEKENTYV